MRAKRALSAASEFTSENIKMFLAVSSLRENLVCVSKLNSTKPKNQARRRGIDMIQVPIPNWLDNLKALREQLHASLHKMGENYRGLEDHRNGMRGLHLYLENERRGTGRGHGLRTEVVEGTKKVIRELLRTHNVQRAQEDFSFLRVRMEEFLKFDMPERERLARIQEANQEIVETAYYIAVFPVVFFDEPLPDKYPDPDDLLVHPAVFLNGLLDVISELTKSVGDYLLEAPDTEYNADLIFRLKSRCIGICEGLWRFLDEYEYVYGGVIDLTRFFAGKYKSKVRRQADNIRRMKEQLLELREQRLFAR